MTASASRDPGPARGGVFARLSAELDELGFEPARPVAHPHDTVYTATDSGAAITTVADAPDPHVCVSARRGDGTTWTMHWTATTPVGIQLIALYAAVNEDAAAAAAAALGVPPPAGPARPSPTAG